MIRTALGQLQDDPDNEQAYLDLKNALAEGPVEGMSADEVRSLLGSARRAHEMRREYDAVASLLELEVLLAQGADAEAPLLAELARVVDEELFDDARAADFYKRILTLTPSDQAAEEALERSDAKRSKWNNLVVRYVEEAGAAGEPTFKSSLLVSAAEVAYRYGRAAVAGEKGAKKKLAALNQEIVSRLKEALDIDPKSRRAGALLERIYREAERWDDLASLLERVATEASAKEEKTAGFVRLARVLTKKLGSPERAVAAYERVLDLSPGQSEAVSFLVDFFTAKEMWDHLVALYEEQLAASAKTGQQDVGAVLQVAMVHWKMRGKPEAAEPYFEKLRKAEPAHPGMLGFFRELLGQRGDHLRLVQILTDAQRALPDGFARSQIATELAKLAEEGANATKAIEQWRAILRQDPGHQEARDALKRLYRETGGWNHLVDLLRGELEKVGAEDTARLPVLREVAGIYREHVKNDSSLVSVLTQITTLDPTDAEAYRELVRVYDALGRVRDLLAAQSKLAEIEEEPSVRAELYRQVARRWLDQFSNVQNAIEGFEKLHETAPDDREAIDRLKELYAKRRAYKPLFDLLEHEAAAMGAGPERRELWQEMAKLAADRLDRGPDAVRLYKQVIDEDPGATAALDALEKQAERDKDYATVAEVLERRVEGAEDDLAKLAVLQKLGAIYSERLSDHAGAMRTWQRVLQLSPGHPKALRVLRDSYLATADYDGLTDLFAASSDWEGLAEVLSNAADRATDAAAKVELSYRAADVYEQRISAPERAFRAYERVLSVRPDDERAARALIPLYENDEKWARLPVLYEVLFGHAASEQDKLQILDKLVDITGENLQDRAAAFRYAQRAYELAPGREDALARFETAAVRSGEWPAFVAAVEARLGQKKLPKEEKRALKAKIAETYATQLGRVDEAVAAYKALVEEDEQDEEAMATLDRILRSADRREDLRWLYELRVTRANTSAKLELLSEWATIEEEALGAPDRAIALHRRVLEIVPQHGRSLRALSRLLQGSGDAEEAAAMLLRDRDQREGKERAQREIELARLYMGSLKQPNEALEAIKRALELVPGDAVAVGVLEELLSVAETRAKAAALLEKHYGESGEGEKRAQVIEVLIATAAAKGDRLDLYNRLIEVQEGLGNTEAAFDVGVRATDEFPGDLPTWDRLSVLANRTGRMQAFVDALTRAVPLDGSTNLSASVEVDLAERIATLHDDMGELDRARPYLERVLARDPANERAFGRLKQILTSLERWEDLEALYERAVNGAPDPVRQAELLAEVALVAEEITGDHPKAIQYYERILEIDPLHDQATRALETLYALQDRWDNLGALLTRRLEGAVGEEALGLRLRLGKLYSLQLNDPEAAHEHLDAVLQADPESRDARELVEKSLELPALRARAAVTLETVYVAQDAWRDLVRVLEVRTETAENDEDRAELLRRIAELQDDRLNEDVSALDTYAKLVPLAPDDERARTRLMEIARRVGAHEQAAEVLAKAAAVASSPQPKGEILMAVARIYEDLLDDSTKAEAVFRQVLEIDGGDATLQLPAARALERIYAAADRPKDVAQMIRTLVKLEDDADARRELWGRLGELCETSLDDAAGAIEAWRARLDDDPGDEQALAALDRLYERTGDHKALVEILRAREHVATDGDARKTFMTRLAVTLAEKLSDVNEAILAYRAVLDDFGAERAVLGPLAQLYEVSDRWDDLAETLEADLAMADAPADRLVLLARLGEVRAGKLSDLDGALEAYRQALTLEPSHAESRKALEALLDDENARRDAAQILRPLYEADGENGKLLRVLDIEAAHADSPIETLAILAQAVVVAEQSLSDVSKAFDYSARGLEEAVAEAELPQWLERTERLAEASGRHADFVGLLKKVAPEILDENVQLDVMLKVAELARTKVMSADDAREYYEKALAIRGDDRRALQALEELYAEKGDHPALLDILKRRAESAEEPEDRKTFLYKQAKLCDEALGDQAAAIDTYEQILDLGLEDEAISALEHLYAARGRWGDLVGLYERQIGQDPPDEKKANLHQSLGSVAREHMLDHERAFEEYEAALKLDAQHAATVTALEGLMKEPEYAARAAEMLEGVYLARLDWRNVMATIEARLTATQDIDERRQLLRRLAKLHEEQEENYLAALETTAKLLAEDVTDEGTWNELERLARVANATGRLAEVFAGELAKVTADEPATAQLARRTGELFETQKDTDRALEFYRRAYAFDPEESSGVFEAIDRLLREANRPKDRVALYREALEYRNDPADRLTTLHTIALLEESELSDDDAAIETYRAALDLDEADTHSLEALSRLYARRGRYKDLAELTRRRAEQAALPEDEARFRYELGQLLQNRLDDQTGAIDEYQTVVELLPPGSGSEASGSAVKAMEQLLEKEEHKARIIEILRPIYERADDWKHLVHVNEERLALADDDHEKVSILRETAKLWEDRGEDRERAFVAVRDAFVLDPDDGESREELDRLAEATGRWDELAEAYERGIERTEDFGKRDLLGALARLHDQKRDDPRRALEAYDRVFHLDESDIEPLEAMDDLATLLSDWSTLVRVLAKKAELENDDTERASTWRRIGEARRDMLEDAPGAIEAYERALELEPDSASTLDHLIGLYEQKNDAARLVDLYRRRIEIAGEEDQDLKYRLLVEAANRYEFGLNDRREAIALLGEALGVRPGDAEVMRRLEELYAAEKMWPELLDNLRLSAAQATDEDVRRTLKKRIGALLAGELEDPQQALEAYREVLERGFDDEAAKAVRDLGESREELRADAADALEPVMRSAERHQELADVLEMRLRAQTDPQDRARTLRAIAEVAEGPLSDAQRAQDALLRALVEEPGDAQLHADIERLSEKLGKDGWSRYADSLADRAGAIFDAEVTTDLFNRLGRIAETQLADDARAAKAFVQAAEQSGDNPEVLASLDRLFSRLGDAKSLADVLERRVGVEADAAAQAELTFRLASLQIKEFGEKQRGLSTLRSALERVPDHAASREALEALLDDDALFQDAFEALEWVYRTLGKGEDLAKLYERRVARARDSRERIRSRLDLARVLDEQVHDSPRAQRVVEQALAEDPSDPDALDELERLAPITSGWKEAADALAAALSAENDVPTATRTELWVKVASWRRDKLEDARGAEDAFVAARKLDPDSVEVIRALEDLQRAPGRERELIDTLRARAKVETDLDQKRQILREAKALAEGTVGDPALAEAVLRDLLVEDEADLWALEELGRLREQAGAWDDVTKLLLRRAELEMDGHTVAELRHRAAAVLRDEVKDADRAIALYEEIFEANRDDDDRAAKALRALYAEHGKNKELARLLSTLVEMAGSEEQRSTLRVELARLQDTMGDTQQAIDTLRGVLEEKKGHAEAVVALSELLEKSGKDDELADLLQGQLKDARERGDLPAELALQVRLGEVFENRLKDTTKALATFEAVLEREPTHRAALEAVARLCEGRAMWDRAAEALSKLVEATTEPADGVALALRLAKAREALGDDAGALAALQAALRFDSKNAEVRDGLRARYEKAKKWTELAELLTEDANFLEDESPGEEKPAAAVTQIVKLLRRAAEIHVGERGAPGEAVPLLERASSYVPQDRELLLLLCDAYTASGREKAAAEALEKVIASFGGKRSKELSIYHHRLGRAHAAMGDSASALTQYDLAFRIDPGSVPVLRDLGVLSMESGDLDRAQKSFRALLLQKLDPTSGLSKAEVFYYLGEVSFKQGDQKKAVQMLERALENDSGLEKAKARLGEIKG